MEATAVVQVGVGVWSRVVVAEVREVYGFRVCF